MLALLLFIAFGLLFGYFATLNTTPVSLDFGIQVLKNIPMYVVVISSFGIGVILASLFYNVKFFAVRMLVHKKEAEYEESQKAVAENLRKAHQLELENAKLKARKGVKDVDGQDDDENSI